MRTTKLYLSFLIALLPLFTLQAHHMPRLTVVVVVDGLELTNIERLQSVWAPGGLRTIARQSYLSYCTYDQLVYGGDETLATLMTGSLPADHGYTMDGCFSRTDRTPHSTLEDRRVTGIGTRQTLSPRAIATPMLTDLMRMRYGEHSQLYAIGIRPEATLLLAGHAANGCCWIEPQQRQWCTSSYYVRGLPAVADEHNTSGRFAELAAEDWRPTMPIDMYGMPTPAELKKPFHYPASSPIDRTPRANQLVIDLALRLQTAQRLGEDQVPDVLLLQLTTMTPCATSDRIRTAEQEDMYLRLNDQLGMLIDTLQHRVGKSHVNFYFVGRPVYGIGAQEMKRAGLAVQEFDLDRMAALTNTYLMALYGNERWVDGAYGQALYLNRELITRKRLSLQEIQRRAADFISEFEGIHAAYTQSELLYSDMQPSLSKRHQGDVCFRLERQWILNENSRQVLDYVLEPVPESPLFFLGNMRPAELDDRMQATDLLRVLRL